MKMCVIVNGKGMTMTQKMSELKAYKVLNRWQKQFPKAYAKFEVKEV